MLKPLELIVCGVVYGVCLAIGFRIGNKIADKTSPHAKKAYQDTKSYINQMLAGANINKGE